MFACVRMWGSCCRSCSCCGISTAGRAGPLGAIYKAIDMQRTSDPRTPRHRTPAEKGESPVPREAGRAGTLGAIYKAKRSAPKMRGSSAPRVAGRAGTLEAIYKAVTLPSPSSRPATLTEGEDPNLKPPGVLKD